MKTIDVQLFAPAVAYTQPAAVPAPLSTRTYSIGALFLTPATKAIILKRLPAASFISTLTNRAAFTTLTLRDLSINVPGILTPEGLDLIDEDLAAVPQSEWPSDDQ